MTVARSPVSKPRRPRRAAILGLVFGIFLVVIAVMAVAQAVLVTTHFSVAALETVVSHDRALLRLFVAGNIRPTDLDTDALAPGRVRELELALATIVENGEIARLELRDVGGTVLASSTRGLGGAEVPASEGYESAVGGSTSITLVDADAGSEMVRGPAAHGPLVREYLPILTGGEAKAVVAVWRDATPVLARVEAARRDVILVTLAAALVAATILLLVFWRAQRRLTRQTADLLEAERRDALTGMLNHGSLVALLAEAVEKVRSEEGQLTIALLDVDNFRLLNDTHEHAAGDVALLEVARLLNDSTPADAIIGRYGPDEFLVVSSPDTADAVTSWMELVRTRLADDVSLQFGDSERLPVTVSIGICSYPADAQAATELLSCATAALGAAKASGGDSVRLAQRDEGSSVWSTYDVLQGLVIAIDTKDHYTKRHSEDVARYAIFLARRLGLDEETCSMLLTAGLLHDIGKIGIPDGLLRKPGRLSTEEYLIFRQHVALGDLIVRDLPHIDEVRAGVRHHHERWDGAGYIDGLAGEAIPMVARVLAVADTFSAMTTSRPYRKALGVKEALKRLGDAAGTQLEEGLVSVFIRGIETAADAPLPGDDRDRARLWTPAGRSLEPVADAVPAGGTGRVLHPTALPARTAF